MRDTFELVVGNHGTAFETAAVKCSCQYCKLYFQWTQTGKVSFSILDMAKISVIFLPKKPSQSICMIPYRDAH